MAANINVHNRMLEILKKPDALTDDDIEELRGLFPRPGSPVSIAKSNVADFRINIELIAAIRTFDKASADQITTTNRLTRQILWLTRVVISIALIPVVRDLISFFASK